MDIIYFVCLLILIYIYAGYPLVLLAARLLTRPKPVDRNKDELPQLTLVISAYNEESVIEEKLHNSVSSTYPEERLDIIVVSDASSDRTDEIVSAFAAQNVRLLRMEERCGKSAGLNHAVAAAKGSVVLFTDANAMFEPDAFTLMVQHFNDPEVGSVVGDQAYVKSESGSAENEGLYWKYEQFTKEAESATGSLIGGDGAITAVRKELIIPLASDDLSDFILPLAVLRSGYRNIFEPAAKCFEEGAETYEKEFSRKVRIVNRASRAAWKMRDISNPLKRPTLAFKLISHKWLRWTAGIWMIGCLAANIAIYDQHWFYMFTLYAQSICYLSALTGAIWQGASMPSLISVPYYFCLVNFAALRGIFENFLGRTYTTWQTVREQSS